MFTLQKYPCWGPCNNILGFDRIATINKSIKLVVIRVHMIGSVERLYVGFGTIDTSFEHSWLHDLLQDNHQKLYVSFWNKSTQTNNIPPTLSSKYSFTITIKVHPCIYKQYIMYFFLWLLQYYLTTYFTTGTSELIWA